MSRKYKIDHGGSHNNSSFNLLNASNLDESSMAMVQNEHRSNRDQSFRDNRTGLSPQGMRENRRPPNISIPQPNSETKKPKTVVISPTADPSPKKESPNNSSGAKKFNLLSVLKKNKYPQLWLPCELSCGYKGINPRKCSFQHSKKMCSECENT